MIVGRFGGTSTSPFIAAHVIIPRLNIEGDVSFLLDTGAAATILAPADALRLGVQYDQLGDRVREFGGVGGLAYAYIQPALLLFSEFDAVHAYDMDSFSILKEHPDHKRIPSLLGRDVLNQWEIVYDASALKLHATVRTASYSIDLPPVMETE